MSKIEQRIRALESFKDWSNYLLVTTVAALGWLSNEARSDWLIWLATGCFAVSTVFAIFTLALIPEIAENITDAEDGSIYETAGTPPVILRRVIQRVTWLNEWWLREPKLRWLREPKLRHFCLIQHFLFIVGIVLYAASKMLSPELRMLAL